MFEYLKQKINFKNLPWIILAVLVIASGSFAGAVYFKNHPLTWKKAAGKNTPAEDKYAAFTKEVYATIKTNYWNTESDADLSNLYLLAAQKVATTSIISLPSKDQDGVGKLMLGALLDEDEKTKMDITAQINNVVLANLQPFGRSGLYTQQLTKNLQNEVNNVNPSDNLYAFLGLDKTATPAQVNQAYKQQAAKLENQNSTTSKDQLTKITRAQAALGAPAAKQTYDQTGAEPAVTGRLINPNVLYTDWIRFSPTMLQDFDNLLKANQNANSLIIDLRGNIGGAIDIMPYAAGIFVGGGQYAYSFYQNGTSTPVLTTLNIIPELAPYKKVVVLTDGQTQSSAELLASVLKKYHIGVVVGSKTKGWGTVESDFDLKNQIDDTQHYSVFLVHTLTLREDNQPVEGNGVVPNIDISDKSWPSKLLDYFNYQPLVSAVQQVTK